MRRVWLPSAKLAALSLMARRAGRALLFCSAAKAALRLAHRRSSWLALALLTICWAAASAPLTRRPLAALRRRLAALALLALVAALCTTPESNTRSLALVVSMRVATST